MIEEVIKVGKKWFSCEIREVQIEDEKYKVLKSSDWARRDKSGGEKDEDSIGLNNSQWGQEYSEILRTY